MTYQVITASVIYASRKVRDQTGPGFITVAFRDGFANVHTVNLLLTKDADLDLAENALCAVIGKAINQQLTGWLVRLAIDETCNQVSYIGSLSEANWFKLGENSSSSVPTWQHLSAKNNDLSDPMVSRDLKGLRELPFGEFIVARLKVDITSSDKVLRISIELSGKDTRLVGEFVFDGFEKEKWCAQILRELLELGGAKSLSDLNGKFLRVKRHHESTVALSHVLHHPLTTTWGKGLITWRWAD